MKYKEPMRGLEPLNLPFTKRLLYQLSYIGLLSLITSASRVYETSALPLSYNGLVIADTPDYTVCPLLCQAFFQPEPYDLVVSKRTTK
jgi:hypothetical protein